MSLEDTNLLNKRTSAQVSLAGHPRPSAVNSKILNRALDAFMERRGMRRDMGFNYGRRAAK